MRVASTESTARRADEEASDEFGMGGNTDTYPIDMDAEVDAARAALTDAGIEYASIWMGEPGTPDMYRTGSILWAA